MHSILHKTHSQIETRNLIAFLFIADSRVIFFFIFHYESLSGETSAAFFFSFSLSLFLSLSLEAKTNERKFSGWVRLEMHLQSRKFHCYCSWLSCWALKKENEKIWMNFLEDNEIRIRSSGWKTRSFDVAWRY